MTSETTSDMTGPASYLPAGYTSLTPYFCVQGAEQAIAFYEAVLGAREVSRNVAPDGTVAHCELELARGRMQLSEPAPEHRLVPASGAEEVSRSTVAYVPDVDAAYARAVELGAKGYGAPETFVTGDRYALVLDPWGHRWALMTRVEDVEAAEAQRRVSRWLDQQA